MQQYACRIKLLDAGLIEAAHDVGRQSPSGSSEAQNNADDIEDQGEETAEIPAETAAQFVKRLVAFTDNALAQARRTGAGGKDDYKDGLVYEERKALLSTFVKALVGWKRCQRCQA